MPQYHIHMSHISRHIPAYLNHNIQKYRIDYNHSLFTVPLIPKNTCFGSTRMYYKTKKNKTKQAVSNSHPICGPICKSTACTGLVPERRIPRRSEQSPIVIISYKGYSPPKCSYSDQTHTHSSKNMHIPTRMSTCHG